MKKTFTINISGIIFHIDDDAYNKLNAYIAKVKSHFNNFDGKDEVIADIENRIAEILQSKLSETKEVIVLADIDEVVKIMGEPSEFTEDETEDSQQNYAYSTSYKRLYRDPENKIIGGVASGIGAYLHLDPVWVRLLFVLLVFTSLGVPIYIILWIAVPDAISPSERLQMKGEKVNISNIEKSVKEEFDHIKEKFSDFTTQAKETYRKKSDVPKTFFENLLGVLGDIFSLIGKGIVIFLGILLLIIGFSLTLGLLAGMFGWAPFMINDPDFMVLPLDGMFDFFLSTSSNTGLLKLGLFFFIGIPVVMILYAGIRIIFGFERIKGLGGTAFALWIVGLALCVAFTYRIASNFRYDGEDISEIKIEQFDGNLLNLKVGDEKFFNDSYFEEVVEIDNFEVLKIDDDYYLNDVQLEITESETNEITIIKHLTATGKTYMMADRNAEEIEYHVKQVGNTLYFNEFFKLPKGVPYLNQRIWLELRIPPGYNINMDSDINKLLDKHRYYRHNRYNKRYNHFFKMTIHGIEIEDGLDKLEDGLDRIEDKINDIGDNISDSVHSYSFSMVNTIPY